MSCLPSLSPDAGECASGSSRSRGTQPAVHSADHDLEDHRSAVMAEASGSVLPWGGLSEEAATPGHPLRVKRVLGNPPAIHPREPPETTGLPQCFGRALRTSHASNANTLCEVGSVRKKKLTRHCAEAVQDGNFLWKAQEKRGEIPA